MKSKLLSSLLLCAAFSASASGLTPPTSHYLSVDVGVSNQGGVSSSTSQQGDASLTWGQNYSKQISTELAATSFGTRSIPLSGFNSISWSSQALSFAGVIRTELKPGLTLTTKGGFASTVVSAGSSSISSLGFLVGVGAEYAIDRNWSMRGNLDIYPDFAGSGSALSGVTLGLKYQF